MEEKMLIIIRGLPGSGKTTFAKKMFPECLLLEADMLCMKELEYKYTLEGLAKRVWAIEDITRKVLSLGADVVITGCFSRKVAIERYKEWAIERGHEVLVYMLHTAFGSVHDVPPATTQIMRGRWEEIEGEIHVRGGERC